MKKGWPLFLFGALLILSGCASKPAKTTVPVEPEAGAQPAQPRSITSLDVSEDASMARVTIRADQPLIYTAVKHQFPLAVVLYFPDTALEGLEESYKPESALIGMIQTSALKNKRPSSRIEIRLNKDVPYKVARLGSEVAVLFSKAMAAEDEPSQQATGASQVRMEAVREPEPKQDTAVSTPKPALPVASMVATGPAQEGQPAVLKRIDFQLLEKGASQIILETDREVSWETLKSSDNRILLKFYHTRIPKFQKRPLITTRFESAVDRILPVQTEKMGDTAVLAIELREAVPYRVHKDETAANIYLVDFEPSSVPPRPDPDAEKSDWIQSMKETQESVVRQVAQEPSQPVITEKGKTYTGEKISLDFQDADIHNIFRILHEISGRNFVIGEDVKGRVTLKLVNVPWDQVLDLVLNMNKLGTVAEGNVVRIATLATLEAEQQALAKKKKAEESARELEPLVTHYVKLNYASAADVKKHLDEIKTSRGRVTTDDGTNMIILNDEAAAVQNALQLVKQLDDANQEIATRQVLIEARIVEADSSFTRDIGVQWGGDYTATGNNSTTELFGGQNNSSPNFAINLPPASLTSGLGFTFGRIAGSALNLEFRLLAMENQGKGRTISSPKILTLDNQEATIKQVTKIPFQVIEDNTVSIKTEEAGIQLSVTPQITRDDRIRMKIHAEKGAPDWSNTVAGNPAIDTNTADTELFVNDGQTIVIGGILTTEDTVNEARTPFLNKIPVLGWLFKQRQTVRNKDELLIFITPKIVRLEENTQSGV